MPLKFADTFVYFYTTNFFDSLTVLNQENIRGGKKSISTKLTNQIKGFRTNLLFRNRIISYLQKPIVRCWAKCIIKTDADGTILRNPYLNSEARTFALNARKHKYFFTTN